MDTTYDYVDFEVPNDVLSVSVARLTLPAKDGKVRVPVAAAVEFEANGYRLVLNPAGRAYNRAKEARDAAVSERTLWADRHPIERDNAPVRLNEDGEFVVKEEGN